MAGLDLVGCVDELELSRGLLRRALEGTRGVLLVGGEAGVGRSRLVTAVAAEASAMGFRPGLGACVRMDSGALTYAAVVGALRALVGSIDAGEIAATLGAHRHEVARLVPEVARPSPDAQPPDRDDPLARLRLFEALTGWLNRLAGRGPLLLAVEDLHWADAATLDLVRALAVGMAGPTVLVVSLRTDEAPAPPVRATVAELVRDGAERVELQPFNREQLAQVVAAAARPGDPPPDVDVLDRLLERSGGNPFLVAELVEAGLAAPGPTDVVVPRALRDIVDARLAALDDRVLDVLRAAALHPGLIDDGLLAAVLDRPVREIGGALREAGEAGVLAAGGGPVGFRHAIQREVLVEQLGPGERRALHAAYADALANRRDPAGATASAWHRDEAGDGPGALAAHVAALGVAMGASAFEAAAGHASRAAVLRAAMPGDASTLAVPELLERASLAALLAGDPAGAVVLARQALGEAGDDDVLAAALHERVRWALWQGGDRAGAAAELRLAVERLGAAPAPALRARLLAEQAAVHMDEADPGPALAGCDAALRLARDVGFRPAEALALGIAGRTLAMHGEVDEGLERLRQGIAIADELGNLQGHAAGVATVAAVLARWGRSREALADIDAALRSADAAGLGRSLGPS